MPLSHICLGKSRLMTEEPPSQEPSLISWMEGPRETLCLEPLLASAQSLCSCLFTASQGTSHTPEQAGTWGP